MSPPRPADRPAPPLVPHAQRALARAGFSRRDFLRGSGALIVSFSLSGTLRGPGIGLAAQFNGAPSPELDSWLAIAADGRVTAYTGKCELGQGLYTAQVQLIAEELAVPLDRVSLIQCDTALTPDQGTTSGAQSHPANFNTGNLALAGATARARLLRMAAALLRTPLDSLAARDGAVFVRTDPARRATYGELIGGRRFDVELDRGASRRDPSEWTVLGTPVPRVDLPAMVTGGFEYVHHVRVPGMLHGRVVRPPAVGARLVRVDEGSVREVGGLVRVVVRHDFVGVVAEKPWQAIQAANRLAVTWTPGVTLPSQRDFHAFMRAQATRDARLVDSGDVEKALAGASHVVEATYLFPYQMHGSVGSSCAVADVRGDRATLWSATQAVHPLRNTIAMLLGLAPEGVRVIFRMGSGCYGINGADTVSYDAALLSQAVGRPVRVQLARRDEMAWENFGFAFVLDERVGVDEDGRIIAWDHETWSPTRGGRPGTARPGNVVTGMLAGFDPAPFAPQAQASAPARFNNNSNAVPSYVAGRVGGEPHGTGTVTSERVLTHTLESPFWTGPLRSPWRLQNTFAHECVMDEVAARVNVDPVEYRLRHVRDPRLIEVVRTAASAARWERRPSPRAGVARNGVVAGRGVACVLYEGGNGYCAMVAEVEVDQDTGEVAVKRLVVALDCGPVSNPDGTRNQIEGGAIQGMSRALVEEVTWNDRQVTSVDWRTYATLSLGLAVPVIESVLVNRADVPATGAGETAITVTVAAIGNAVFDATGARLRQVPFTPDRVRAALGRDV